MTSAAPELPAFQRHQLEFTAHIRDPERIPAPRGIEERRMAVYRELFYNNVEGTIARGFPVLRSITPDAVWHARIRRFFADHKSSTPYFAEIAQEFLQWLGEERGQHPDDPPFILELAHYEWVELALYISDESNPEVDHNGDLLAGQPVTSAQAWALAYHFPVHRISPDFQPDTPSDTPSFLAIYRDRQDEIHFLEINAVTQRLLNLLKENPAMTGRNALKTIADEMQHPDPEAVIEHGRKLLDDLRERNIIIGTRIETVASGA